MRLPRFMLLVMVLAVCRTSCEVSEEAPEDQEVSETGHRRARFWKKMLKNIYSQGHKLMYPAAYLLGNYAKNFGGYGYSQHHKGHSGYDYGYIQHHKGHPGYDYGYSGHAQHQGHIGQQGWYGTNPHTLGHGLEYGSQPHALGHGLEGAHSPWLDAQHHGGLYPVDEGWGSAWDDYGWGDHSLHHGGFWPNLV